MFYRNQVPTLKTKRKTFIYDLFADCPNDEKDDFVQNGRKAKRCYNFRINNGRLENGYGFTAFKSPKSPQNLAQEEVVELVGDNISSIWSFKWHNETDNSNQYYMMYYNGSDNFHFDNLFGERLLSLTIPCDFTSTPIGCPYRYQGQDVMVFSGEGSPLKVIGANFDYTVESAPKLISICTHYDKLFAITAGARGSLVYTDNTNILEWNDEQTKHIEFNDERGNLNKILSFNDYLYLFRDFGITKISTYSTKEDFSISHLYQADGYIYPGSIASGGDKIYFLERSGLKVFNGTSTKSLPLECDDLLTRDDNQYSSGVCFEGKYYLACRLNFDDGKKVGCENNQDFVNNALLVYDQTSGEVEISRGMDVRTLTVLNNPLKSKLVACFNDESKNKIGQIEKNGKLFDESLPKEWRSVKTNFGKAGKLKKINKIHLISENDCAISFSSERQKKSISVVGKSQPQTISTSVLGEVFELNICADGEAKITSFQIEYLES